MSRHDAPDRLRDLLRLGDPAAGESPLSSLEMGRIRARALAVAARPQRRGFRVPAAIAATLLLAMAVWLSVEPDRGPDTAIDAAATSTPAAGTLLLPRTSLAARHPIRPHGPDTAASRELHFTAPKGTRIVWNLRYEAGSGESSGAEPRSRS